MIKPTQPNLAKACSPRLRHPVLGPIEFEYSVFAVDGRPDPSMVTYNPVAPGDVERIRRLIEAKASPESAGRQSAD